MGMQIMQTSQKCSHKPLRIDTKDHIQTYWGDYMYRLAGVGCGTKQQQQVGVYAYRDFSRFRHLPIAYLFTQSIRGALANN